MCYKNLTQITHLTHQHINVSVMFRAGIQYHWQHYKWDKHFPGHTWLLLYCKTTSTNITEFSIRSDTARTRSVIPKAIPIQVPHLGFLEGCYLSQKRVLQWQLYRNFQSFSLLAHSLAAGATICVRGPDCRMVPWKATIRLLESPAHHHRKSHLGYLRKSEYRK